MGKTMKDINKSITEMQRALLGIATQEEDMLGNLKVHLDALLGNVYTQTKEFQKIAARDAMISETPITQADEALIEGIDHVSKELNLKNEEIKKLQRLLALLGVETAPGSSQSLEMLRQSLEELNKRNRILRAIQQRLVTHPLITGQVPKGITPDEIKRILVKLNDEIKVMNKTNYDLKQQIKLNRLQTLKEKSEMKPQDIPTPPRRGPGGR